MSGGAILAENTQRFAECVLCVDVFQGYGLTETCAGGTITDHYDISVGRAGYPIISSEFRLIDWEEGHYKTTDNVRCPELNCGIDFKYEIVQKILSKNNDMKLVNRY
ncbi:unnamed protein product, partial [Adineta steineri]